MRWHTSAFVTAGLAAVLGILSVPDAISAQAEVDQHMPPYNPYPPGILPPDLDAEIARVQREVQFIFNKALSEWRALPLPTLAGNPPTLRGSGYGAVEIRQAAEFRPKHVAVQERGLRLLPYALRRLQRTDTVRQSDDGRLSRNISLSGRQAHRTAIYVFTGFPCARIQHNAGRVLWRK